MPHQRNTCQNNTIQTIATQCMSRQYNAHHNNSCNNAHATTARQLQLRALQAYSEVAALESTQAFQERQMHLRLEVFTRFTPTNLSLRNFQQLQAVGDPHLVIFHIMISHGAITSVHDSASRLFIRGFVAVFGRLLRVLLQKSVPGGTLQPKLSLATGRPDFCACLCLSILCGVSSLFLD